MIKILTYNHQYLRFPFTVKRKGHGNFQRSTRKTGGEAAAVFAMANCRQNGKRRLGAARQTQTENRQRRIPLGSPAARGILR